MTDRRSDIRAFDLEQDLEAVKRIWREVGWVTPDTQAALDHFFTCGTTLVGTLDDAVECSVHTVPGEITVQKRTLPLCAVTAVTTSRVARGYSFAQNITARQLTDAKRSGAVFSALGIFDQGFYDKLGFGTGAYDHELTFDPAQLLVDAPSRSPVRLSIDDSAEMHACLLSRKKTHGAVNLLPDALFAAETRLRENTFGLGYRDAQGELTHFVWVQAEGERGPYRVLFMAYRDPDQMLELLGLLKTLSDQVYSVIVMEPPEIQLQSLLKRPFRNMALTKNSPHSAGMRALAWWQMRVLDVPGAVAGLEAAQTLSFDLVLDDPLSRYETADEDAGGRYTVHLGDASRAEPGEGGSPAGTLTASVNAFTRWLLGVAPASSLAITDEFSAAPELLERLDAALVLPRPIVGWDF